jgi:hypothetical protein
MLSVVNKPFMLSVSMPNAIHDAVCRGAPNISLFILNVRSENTSWGGRLSTVEPLIKVACFVKHLNKIFNIKGADLS